MRMSSNFYWFRYAEILMWAKWAIQQESEAQLKRVCSNNKKRISTVQFPENYVLKYWENKRNVVTGFA